MLYIMLQLGYEYRVVIVHSGTKNTLNNSPTIALSLYQQPIVLLSGIQVCRHKQQCDGDS